MTPPDPSIRAAESPHGFCGRATHVRVHTAAIAANLAAVRSSTDAAVMAMVKADAYGHSTATVAPTLHAHGVRRFGVATVEEACALRTGALRGLPMEGPDAVRILVHGGRVWPGALDQLLAAHATPVLGDLSDIPLLNAALAARQHAKTPREPGPALAVHLMLDTGMGRMGLTMDSDWDAVAQTLSRAPHLRVEGLATHFARADGSSAADTAATQAQLDAFIHAASALQARGIRPAVMHLANSAAVYSGFAAEAHARIAASLQRTDIAFWVRPGLMLYGMTPADRPHPERPALHTALSWHAPVVSMRTVPAGTPVSYGGTAVTQRPTVLATLGLGYADGYSRALSNRGTVRFAGGDAPVCGRVCMDFVVVDVTDLEPQPQHGDLACLLGPAPAPSPEAMADLLGTIPYEVCTRISVRVPRVARTGDSAW